MSRIEMGSRATKALTEKVRGKGKKKKEKMFQSTGEGGLLPDLIGFAIQRSALVSISPWNSDFEDIQGITRGYDESRGAIMLAQYTRKGKSRREFHPGHRNDRTAALGGGKGEKDRKAEEAFRGGRAMKQRCQEQRSAFVSIQYTDGWKNCQMDFALNELWYEHRKTGIGGRGRTQARG